MTGHHRYNDDGTVTQVRPRPIMITDRTAGPNLLHEVASMLSDIDRIYGAVVCWRDAGEVDSATCGRILSRLGQTRMTIEAAAMGSISGVIDDD